MALAGGTVALAASGAALAAAPTLPFGGNGFTVDNGNFNPADLTDQSASGSVPCPVDSVCTTYEGGDGTDGLLQREVVYTDPTSLVSTAYIQAIVAETGVEEYVTGQFTDQTFANEQIVRLDFNGGTNATNIAQKMIMHEDNPTVDGDEFSGTHVMLGADYYDGVDLFYALDQSVGLGGTSGAKQLTRIRGEITGTGGNLNGNSATYKRVGIDQIGTGTPTGSMGDFIFRSNVRDFAAPQALVLPDVGGAPDQTISTGTGVTALQALYIDGPNGLNPFDFQRFASNIGVDGDLSVANVIEVDNADPDELPTPATGPWNWGGGSVAEAVFGAENDTTSSAIDLWDYN
jgi:hypothetical protein